MASVGSEQWAGTDTLHQRTACHPTALNWLGGLGDWSCESLYLQRNYLLLHHRAEITEINHSNYEPGRPPTLAEENDHVGAFVAPAAIPFLPR